jgi:hypothetical protein
MGAVPLPDARNAEWPPRWWKDDARLIEESRLWLAGDIVKLGEFYGGTNTDSTRWRRFVSWLSRSGVSDQHEGVDRLHVPLPRQIARTSAALLFSEPPALQMPGAHDDTGLDDNGEPLPPNAEQQAAIDAEERLAQIAHEDSWAAKLLQAAYVQSGTGGIYLRPNVNPQLVPGRPFLEVIHHDRAVPVFQSGHLVEVTFWTEVERSGETVWRHLECHTPGKIEHALYEGNRRQLGDRIELAAKRATKDLRPESDLRSIYGIEGLLPDYVPNMLPHPVTLSGTIGGADCSGIEDQLTALNQADTEWAQDVELGGRKVIVPDQFLTRTGRAGDGAYLDRSQRVFSPMSFGAMNESQETITMIDFDIRAADFEATITNRTNRTSVAAGYNAESVMWANTGQAMTATEVLSRDSLSADTTSAKRQYWNALGSCAEKVLMIDAVEFGSGVTPMRPTVVWPSAGEQDMRETASMLNLLNLAGAVSTTEKVRMLHPEWTPSQVDAEVGRIRDDEALEVGDPTGFGV